jgi:hypothetical protein
MDGRQQMKKWRKMLKAIKKDGQIIMFDSLNISNHNIKDAFLKGHMN